jgi:hypothetical protein
MASAMDTGGLPLPCVDLVGDEQLVCTHPVEYLDRQGFGWLTSKRVIVRVTEPNSILQTRMAQAPTPAAAEEIGKMVQFLLPLAQITSHNVSAATNMQKLMLKLNYTGAKGAANVVLRFVSTTALDDRTKWKEYLTANQGGVPGAPAVLPAVIPAVPAAAATPPPPPATPATPAMPSIPAVKTEPGLTAASKPTTTPRTPSGKRTHGSAHGPGAANSSGAISEQQSLIRARAALLARDPELQAVHNELVPSAVSEEEFWLSRTDQLRQEQGRQSGGAATVGNQKAGISSAMASTIRPETGCNEVRYTLDASQIHAIFLENPMVYELYQSLVPDQLDEKTFWTKYFKSQYIHSQASSSVESALSRNVTEEDLFARVNLMQEEREQERLGEEIRNRNGEVDPAEQARLLALSQEKKDIQAKATIVQRRIDPSVDLTSADMSDTILQADHSKSSGSEAAPSSNTTRSKKARAQTELLQKFNRHGMLVLDSNLNNSGKSNNNASAPMDTSVDRLQASYHSSLSSSLDLLDLSIAPAPSYNTLSLNANVFESLGARRAGAGARKTEGEVREERRRYEEGVQAFLKELGAFPSLALDTSTDQSRGAKSSSSAAKASAHSVQHIPASAQSRDILLELTSTARGMNKAAIAAKQLKEEQSSSSASSRLNGPSSSQQLIVFSTNSSEPDMIIPDQFREELRKRYHTCTELFRHFWTSLNVRTQAKLQRVHAALDEQYRLLQVIRSSLNSRGYSQLVPLLNPLIASIDMCSSTFQKWQEKQAKTAAMGGKMRAGNNLAGARAPTPTTNQVETEPDSKRIKV